MELGSNSEYIDWKNKLKICVFSLVFAFFQTIGVCIYEFNDLKTAIYQNDYIGIVSKFLIFFLLAYFFFNFLHLLLRKNIEKNNYKWVSKIRYNRPIIFTSILLMWLPWIVAFYPGSPFYDMTLQLEQYYGATTPKLHPVFSTILMGFCMDIGKTIFNSDNIGLFTYILLQYVIVGFACEESLKTINRFQASNKMFLIILLFYGLFPLFGSNVQWGVKDVMSYGLILLAVVQIINLIVDTENKIFSKKHLLLYFLYSLFSSLYRKEMIYIYILVDILLFLLCLKKKIVILLLVVMCMSNILINDLIIDIKFNGQFNSISAESISIPLQQVARMVTYYSDDISENEKEIIGECFNYGYEGISNNYNPNFSDPIKDNFDYDKAKENGFWNVYISLLKRKPLVFMESVLASSYGYFSIVPNVPATVNDAPTNGLPGERTPRTYMSLDPDDDYNNVNIYYDARTDNLKNVLNSFLKSLDLPYNPLYSFGFYTWIILFFFIETIGKKRTAIIAFAIPILLILVCVASPVNDYVRYYMGVIYLFPLLFAYTLSMLRESTKCDLKGYFNE